ncbi:SMT3 [Sanghuangporus weigelae]
MSDEENGNVPPPTMQEETEEAVAPKQEDPNTPINIKVLSAQGEEVFFKIKRSTKLSKLQTAYAHKIGKEVNTIRFLYDGERINEDDTPNSLEMEDNDTIDVMVERQGWRLSMISESSRRTLFSPLLHSPFVIQKHQIRNLFLVHITSVTTLRLSYDLASHSGFDMM